MFQYAHDFQVKQLF